MNYLTNELAKYVSHVFGMCISVSKNSLIFPYFIQLNILDNLRIIKIHSFNRIDFNNSFFMCLKS